MSNKNLINLVNAIVFIFVFILLIYFYLQVDLSLIYHVQQPFFTNTLNFLNNHLSYPGGISDYLGLFVVQFYGNEIIALLLVIIQLSVWIFLIYKLIKDYLPAAYLPLPLALSAIPLIVGYGIYFSPVEILDSFIISIGLTVVLRSINLKNKYYSILFFLTAILVYYLGGSTGLSIFLATMVAFLFYEKKYLLLFICIVWIVILPYFWHLFDRNYTSIKEVYFGNLIKNSYDKTIVLIKYSTPILLFIILQIALYISGYIKKIIVNKWLFFFNFIVVLPVIYFLTYSKTFQPELKNAIQIDKFAYEEKWDELLNNVDKQNIKNESILSLVNRALYHKGILLDYLFYYPQSFSHEALIIKDPIVPLSEIYFDLGYINELRHWANEALIVMGKKPRILESLVESYIITGHYNTAEIYLKILESSFITKSWALEQRKYLNCDSCVENDPKFGRLRKMNPSTDFFAAIENPNDNLKNLFTDSIYNQMAFEYYIAHLLLTNEPEEVYNNINNFKRYGFTQLPKTCQEAILIYKAAKRIKTLNHLSGYIIDKSILHNFNSFSKILFVRYKGNREAARNSLSNFNQTYWYYYIYSKLEKNKNSEKGVTQQ